MTSKPIYHHYVYRITNIVENKHYYGKRSSKNRTPKEDLGKRYFSSSGDSHFREDQRTNPQNYKYKIIRCFLTAKEAIEFEVFVHKKFNVGRNPKFYNKVMNSTKRGYDCTGITLTEEHKSKIGRKEKPISNETREKMAIAKIGHKQTKEQIEKRLVSIIGVAHKEDRKNHMREVMSKPQNLRTCPHCGKTGGASNLTRYHFDNCNFHNIPLTKERF